MTTQPSQSTDPFVSQDLTQFLFAKESDNFAFGQDLVSRNIQRGRDHGTQVIITNTLRNNPVRTGTHS
jgi:hypothetical protein